MGEVVNQVTITQTTVRQDAGNYTLEVYWQLNGGSGCTYKGNYTLLLYEDGQEKHSYSLMDTIAAHYTEQEITDLKQEKKYTVVLRADQGNNPVSSEKNKLMIHTFENISGYYNGREMKLTWDKIASDIVKGELTIWSDGMAAYVCEVPVYSNYIRIEGIGFYPTEKISVSFSANDGDNAFGPESEVLEFYEDACEILSLDYTQDAKQTEVVLCMSSWSQEADSEAVQLVFKKYERELLCIDGKVQKNKDVFKVTVDIPYEKLRKEEVEECEIFCYRKKNNALSKIESENNRISMLVPEISLVSRTKDKVQIQWTYSGLSVPDFYVTDAGEKIYASQYTIDMEKSESFKLAAGFGSDKNFKRGSYASVSGVFQEGYYPVLEENGTMAVCYHQSSFSEEMVSWSFPGGLFQTEPEFPVESGSIHLEKQDSGYLLKMDMSTQVKREEYKNFLVAIRDYITPYGFYLLTETVARMVYQNISDSLYLACGYDGTARICDLRPGYILETQTEIYMPQENPKMDNGAGFVTTHREEYAVSFPMEEKGKFLEFNSFVEGFADAMDASYYADTNIIYAGGLRDFLTPKARQPFYRIFYPSSLPDSGESENAYPSDNVVLLAAGSYGEIEEATNSIIKDLSAIKNLSIPVLIFRGRSTLTAAMHIVVNGESMRVPVGITLDKLLQRVGIFCQSETVIKKLRIYRRTPDGKEAEFYWNWIPCPWNQIVLINGDRIEV